MRYVKTIFAKSGDILAHTIYGSDGRILVRANTVLTPFLIQKLAVLGHMGIYLYDPGETDAVFRTALDEHTRIMAAVHLQNIDLDKCIYAANEIVHQVLSSKDMAVEVGRISNHDLCTWTHSVDVCTYSVMCGVAMGYNNQELEQLSQAALLHDIGKTMVDRRILMKPGRLTPDEYTAMKMHVQYGWDLIRKNTRLSATVSTSVYEHHENEDGTGYPRGVMGHQIHRYAKIIHAADVYEALTAVRPYKKALNPADAMENLLSGYGTVFDARVVDVLHSIIVLYPLGSRVLLSDGRTGTVCENRRWAMQRPVVRISDGTSVDLCRTLDVTILDVIDE